MQSEERLDNPNTGVHLADLFELFKRKLELELHVSVPATVVTYTPGTRLATVIPGYLPVSEIQGVEVPQPPVIVQDVPVSMLSGPTGQVTIPIVPGTTGNLIVSDRCLQQWVKKMSVALGAPNPVTVALAPTVPRAHALGDAVFYPGLMPVANAASNLHDNTATVVDNATMVKLGANALTEFLIKGTSFITLDEVPLNTAFTVWLGAFQTAAAPLLAAPDPSGALLWTFMNAMVGPTAALVSAINEHSVRIVNRLSTKVVTE
jgi:hypothetical protein